MKHLFPHSLCYSLFLLLIGCSGNGSEKEELPVTVVEGYLVGSSEGIVELLDRLGGFTYADSVLAKDTLEEGRFHLQFREKDPGYFRLKTPSGGIMLYLSPGDSLSVNRDDQGDYRFKGSGSIENRYIRKRKLFRDSIGREQDSIFKSKKPEFLKGLKARKKAVRSFRRAFFREHQERLGEHFQKLERMRDRVDHAIMRFSYPDIYEYEHPNDSLSLAPSYWHFLDSMNMNDTMMLEVPEYLSFAYDVANKYTLDNKGEQKNMGYREMLFKTILKEFEGKVEEAVLTYFILEQIRYTEKEVQGSLLERYRKHVKDPRMKRFVERKLRSKRKEPSL